MKHLEGYLKPLLERMHRSPAWFFGVLLVIVGGFAFIGATIGWACETPSQLPWLLGLIVGSLLFIGLFALLVRFAHRGADSSPASLTAELHRLDRPAADRSDPGNH